jgi:hypothetical protein
MRLVVSFGVSLFCILYMEICECEEVVMIVWVCVDGVYPITWLGIGQVGIFFSERVCGRGAGGRTRRSSCTRKQARRACTGLAIELAARRGDRA